MIAWIQARAVAIVATILFAAPLLAFVLVTYAVATLLALIASEVVSLAVVASDSSGRLALSITAAGLAAGGCALVAALLLPSGS